MDKTQVEEAIQITVVLIGAGLGIYAGWRYFGGFDWLPSRSVMLFAFFGAAGGVLANIAWLSVVALIEMWRQK